MVAGGVRVGMSKCAKSLSNGGGGREVQEGRDICIHITDALHCTAETSTTL